MKCKECNQEMDEESEDFCKEYKIDTCLTCCGKEYKENAKRGIYYYASIPVYASSQSIQEESSK